MEAFALYLFKSVVWLTGFTLVYLLFLRNERYFLLNRVYLVAGIMASIIFPLFTYHYTVMIPVTPTVGVSDLQMMGVISEPEPFPTQTILLCLYMAGALYLLYRITKQTMAVVGVIRKSEILPYRSAKLIRTADYPASFSFFSFVFVNPSICDTETNEIVNHEMEHIKQHHWIDLMLFEVLCTLQWFNPLSWLYGRFIRQNHEYLADQRALQRTVNPAIYRAALINQLFGGEVISLANSFNYSINKKRFHMMKNTINPPLRKLKLLLILPIIAGVFYAFATPEYKYAQIESNHEAEKLPHISMSINGTHYESTNTEDSNANQQAKTVTGNLLKEAKDTVKGSVATSIEGDFKAISFTEDTNSLDFGLYYFNAKKIQGKSKGDIKFLQGEDISIGLSNTTNQTFFIDGKEATKADVANLNPKLIESISVLKGKSATSMYGEKGKNGVVLIALKKDESKVYKLVEELPEFPGGNAALSKFIVENIKYPAEALKDGIQGKVFISLVVTKKGHVTNAKVVLGVEPSLDQEALRVVELLPRWKPGKQGGKNVDVEYTIPINFELQDNKITDKPAGTDNTVHTVVDEMPEFPGGDAALSDFIGSNVKYPAEAQKKGIQGKVYISFVVTKTGSVTNAKVARSVDPLLDQEALRVVELLPPTWIPGKQGGKDVSVAYTLPINFVLKGKAQPLADPSAQKGKLIIAPNPSNNQVTVTLEGSDYSGKLEVSLFDSYGKLMSKESKNGPSFSLSVSSLTPGTYLVVTSDGSKQYQGHLVVNH